MKIAVMEEEFWYFGHNSTWVKVEKQTIISKITVISCSYLWVCCVNVGKLNIHEFLLKCSEVEV